MSARTPTAQREPFERLTPREREVLAHLCQGHRAARIARLESVALSTIRAHIRSVLQKLGVNSQLQAVALAWRYGVVVPEDHFMDTHVEIIDASLERR